MTTVLHLQPFTLVKTIVFIFLLTGAYSCKKDKSTDESCQKWEYEGVTGPDHWMSLCDDYAECSGIFQSPVNLTAALPDPALKAIAFNYSDLETEIEFNGHTIEFETKKGNCTLNLNGTIYKLQQFHFHTHSEHAVDGAFAGMEMHLVHEDAAGNRVVVGVLFEEGAENAFLSRFMDHLPNKTTTKHSSSDEYNPAEVFPSNRSYFTYPGSLTTPPCTQNVIWFVLENPVEASAEQIGVFEATMHENFRPVRPLQERAIRHFEE
jgi:carbonic anhydrase